jgi:TctA family transporter
MSGYFDQQHRDSSLYIAVFVIGVILSFLSSFLSIIFIYFIEQVRKTKWNIGLHISIIGLHILGVYFLSDFDKDVVVGFLGYAASGVAGYYHFVFRRKYRVPVEHELIDRE